MKRFSTGRNNGAELVDVIPMGKRRTAVLRLALPGLLADEVIVAMGECQVTTDETQFNTMVAGQLTLSRDPLALSGEMVTDITTTNITPAIHHLPIQKMGTITVPGDGDWHLALIVYADSSSGRRNLRVDQSYGHMDAIVLGD